MICVSYNNFIISEEKAQVGHYQEITTAEIGEIGYNMVLGEAYKNKQKIGRPKQTRSEQMMEVEGLPLGLEEESTPRREEIERAVSEISNKFGSHQQKLYDLYVLKHQQRSQQSHSLTIPIVTENQSIKVTTSGQVQFFKHELSHICQFQKRIAAQKFIRGGYGIDLFREQIQQIGGLFYIIDSRYKSISKEIVIQTYHTIEDFLVKHCGLAVNPLSKLEVACLHSILLNCRHLFDRREIIAFMKFVALIFEDGCSSIVMNNQDTLCFYQTANRLLQLKLEEGRKTFKLRYEARQPKEPTALQQLLMKKNQAKP